MSVFGIQKAPESIHTPLVGYVLKLQVLTYGRKNYNNVF